MSCASGAGTNAGANTSSAMGSCSFAASFCSGGTSAGAGEAHGAGGALTAGAFAADVSRSTADAAFATVAAAATGDVGSIRRCFPACRDLHAACFAVSQYAGSGSSIFADLLRFGLDVAIIILGTSNT